MKATFENMDRYYGNRRKGIPTSREWNKVRGLLMYERGGACEDCGSTADLQAAHLTYAHFMMELSHLSDLRLLCRPCHEKMDGKKFGKPKKKPRRSPLGRFIKGLW
jgi:5-methylcytosine-specific restriction endonuclease McrA